MPAFDGSTFAANVQVMLAHRAFAEGEVECRCQTPAPLRPETPREVLGMVVTVVEEHIQDGSRLGFLHFALVTRQETGRPQESGVVGGTGQAKIHLQQPSRQADCRRSGLDGDANGAESSRRHLHAA